MAEKNTVLKKKTKKSNKPPKDSLKPLKDKVAVLEEEIQKETAETKRVQDKNVRLLAEFDNYKRRTQEERGKLLKYAGEDIVTDLLPIVDDLHRTLEADDKSDAKTVIKGVELILSNLDKLLVEKGIIAFDSVGQDFDPDFHEALMSEESDKGEGVILKEFQKGYKYNDKVIRHAKVVVSK